MTTKYTKNLGLALPDFRSGPWHDLVNVDFEKIDSFLYTALSGANVTAWQNSHQYLAGDNALDITDSTVWLCTTDWLSSPAPITFAQERTGHPTVWTRLLTGFAPRGEWAQSTQYFPYDLAYDSGQGIMALCTVKHISTATGSIIDDKANWVFLLDMSDIGMVMASAVSYSHTSSPQLTATNVQVAIDQTEAQIVALNNVNIDQGNRLTSIETVNTTQNSRLTAIEDKSLVGYTGPYFTATQNLSVQFGGSAARGVYVQSNAIALRAPTATGTIYFQNEGGALTYGNITPTGMNIFGGLSITGSFTLDTLSCNYVAVYKGIINVNGYSGNTNQSIIYMNAAQTAYQYFDGTALHLRAPGGYITGPNGRLWGASDTLPIPLSIIDMRLSTGYWDYTVGSAGMVEPGSGLIATGFGFTAGIGYQFRVRYLQYKYNGIWYNVGYG